MTQLVFPGSQGVDTGTTWVDLLSDRAARLPNRVIFQPWADDEAQVSNPLTYGGLDHRSRAIAARIQQHTLPGERVLLLCPPGLDYIVAFCACLYAGVIAVPVYPPRPNQSFDRLRAIAVAVQPGLILTTAAQQARVAEQFEVPCLWVDRGGDRVAAEAAAAWQRPAIVPEDIAFLQYTSGSTAAPKGVQISHGNLLHNVAMIGRKFELTEKSRGVIWLPPYHDMGLIGGILTPLYIGSTATLMSPVDFLQRPLRWLQAISRTQATVSGGPNFAYELCVEKIRPDQRRELDLSHWAVAFTGAEPVRAETLERFAVAFADCGFRPEAFYPCYGLAEATLMVTGGDRAAPPQVMTVDESQLTAHRIRPATHGRQLVSCGQPGDSGKVAIVHPDTCTLCGPEQVGEIWVISPSVAQGYWRQPLATEATFHAYLADTGAGPFLRTGDLGWMQAGELYVTGRLKEILIIRGRNHYASDIEHTVANSHPALQSAWGAAFTVERGSQPQLVVVQEVARRWIRQLDAAAVSQTIRQRVSQVHGLRVETVVLVKPGSIPKTSSGKVQRDRCRSQFLAGQLRPLAATPSVAVD